LGGFGLVPNPPDLTQNKSRPIGKALRHPAKSSLRRLIAQVFAEERRVYCDIDHHKMASFALANEKLMCDRFRQQALRRNGLGQHFNPRARFCCRSAADSPTADSVIQFLVVVRSHQVRGPRPCVRLFRI
jgi:hypothetical protein